MNRQSSKEQNERRRAVKARKKQERKAAAAAKKRVAVKGKTREAEQIEFRLRGLRQFDTRSARQYARVLEAKKELL